MHGILLQKSMVWAETSCLSFTVMGHCSVRSVTAVAGNLEHVVLGGHAAGPSLVGELSVPQLCQTHAKKLPV